MVLVTAKTKVAKKNPPTIPRLELCGAVLLTKLMNNVAAVLTIPLENIRAWTDSSIVLAWLDGRPREFKQFVANRVSFVLEHTRPQTWKHVPTLINPADCASRGMTPEELLHHELWWRGPGWLHQDPVLVPVQPPRRTLPALETRTVHATLVQAEFALNFESRTNNYYLIISLTAWWFRLFHRLKDKKTDNRSKHLTPQELQHAEHWLLKQCQHRCFPKEVQSLQRHHSTAPASRLKALTPFMDQEGLIRVGGRLSKSSLTQSQQHPIILDRKDSLVKKLFLHKHIALSHCGPSLLLCNTGNKIHVLGARRLSRDICSQCVTCRRAAPSPVPQRLGELPPARSQADQPAFSNTGLDFAGPFTIKQGYTRKPVKIDAFICIFVCLATKAVHLEVVSDLTTSAFTACLHRFVSRRNCPRTIQCDNGLNFVGARNELYNLYKFLAEEDNDSLICQYLPRNELYNLNSRPLTPMTSHNQDGLATLTANHFLTLSSPHSYPVDPRLPEEPRLLKRWNQCQSVIQHFWRRWSREYLNTLQSRTKWQQTQPNLRPGDIVIVKEDRVFACHWPLAKVIETYPGEDGLVRVAKIQAATGGPKKRPVAKLALLHRAKDQASSPEPASPGSMSRQEPGQGLLDSSPAEAATA